MTTRSKGSAGSDSRKPSVGLALNEKATDSGEDVPDSRQRVKGARLHELLVARHEEFSSRACARAARHYGVLRAERNFNAGFHVFAGQLVAALCSTTFQLDLLRQAAERQGRSALRMGLSLSQLVYWYGDVYQAVLELGSEFDVPVAPRELLILGSCLDEARATAVAAYERRRAKQVSRQEARELQGLCAELRASLEPALLALAGLKCGAESLRGQAGALDRSLSRLQELVGRSLFRVRSQAADLPARLESRHLDPRSGASKRDQQMQSLVS